MARLWILKLAFTWCASVEARTIGSGRVVSGDRGWLRLLPTLSAVLLMGMGMWMARDAWKSFSAVG